LPITTSTSSRSGPGIAAEEVEQQVTIPLEIAMNGIPHMTSLRSVSVFGLSERDHDLRRRSSRTTGIARKLSNAWRQVTLPTGLQPQMGTDWSPVGQIYWYTLHSTNPAYDVMELKSLEDWVLEKQFKSVPNVVDVSSFGGPTREYQVRLDPNKLILRSEHRSGGAAAYQ
jgi:cobalt-zinc-cadmium resistance protein CzcA